MEDDHPLTMTQVMKTDDFRHKCFVQKQIIFIKFIGNSVFRRTSFSLTYFAWLM